MYYISIFLYTHLGAGLLAFIIDFFFYKEERVEVFQENYENQTEYPFQITQPMLDICLILWGWVSLFFTVKSVVEYYIEPDDDDFD